MKKHLKIIRKNMDGFLGFHNWKDIQIIKSINKDFFNHAININEEIKKKKIEGVIKLKKEESFFDVEVSLKSDCNDILYIKVDFIFDEIIDQSLIKKINLNIKKDKTFDFLKINQITCVNKKRYVYFLISKKTFDTEYISFSYKLNEKLDCKITDEESMCYLFYKYNSLFFNLTENGKSLFLSLLLLKDGVLTEQSKELIELNYSK